MYYLAVLFYDKKCPFLNHQVLVSKAIRMVSL